MLCSTAHSELLLSYPISEGAGTLVADASGNDYDGNIEGALWVEDRFGQPGSALQTGTGDWINPPDAPLSPSLMTVASWIRIDDYSDNPAPIWSAEKGTGSTGFHSRLQITPDGHLRFEAIAPFGTSGSRSTTSAETLDTGVWYHVAGTYDGTTTKIYLDGSPIGSTDYGSTALLNTDATIPKGIGHLENWGVQWFKGRLDDFRLYDLALDDASISNLASIPEPAGGMYLFVIGWVCWRLCSRNSRRASGLL